MDIFVGVADEGENEASPLHDRLAVAEKLEFAFGVDWGDVLGVHVQDHPV